MFQGTVARGFAEGSLLPRSGLHWNHLFRSVLEEWGGGAWVLCSLGVSRRKLTSPSSKKFSVCFSPTRARRLGRRVSVASSWWWRVQVCSSAEGASRLWLRPISGSVASSLIPQVTASQLALGLCLRDVTSPSV